MQKHTDREDELNKFERRLAGWQPASGNLDADAVLFAAGLAAAGRGRGRWLWPVSCAFLVMLAAGLGIWGVSERAERQTLANRLREHAPGSSVAPASDRAVVPEPSYPLKGYLNVRRQAEEDPSRWLASSQSTEPLPPGPLPPEPTILRSGQLDGFLNQ
jgi:hypothetical protein